MRTSLLQLTSVLAQLQLMAVQRKMFISSMMRKSTPNVMASHSSQLGRMPSSQLGEITVKYNTLDISYISSDFHCFHHSHRASAGSNTKTVVPAMLEPSSLGPNLRGPLLPLMKPAWITWLQSSISTQRP